MLAPVTEVAVAFPKQVWLATADQEEAVMELCRLLWEENGLFSLNENKVRFQLRRAFDKKGGILGVVGAPGKLEGMVFLEVSTYWYSEDPHLAELFVYVRPEFRRTSNHTDPEQRFSRVKVLIEFAQWCAQQSHMPLLIGVLSDSRVEGKMRLYERRFGKQRGGFFVYNDPTNKVTN